MPATTSEPFSRVDAAWLQMEDPTNLMMITGVLTFATPVDFDRLQAVLEQRLLRFGRFTMCVANADRPGGTPRWERDPHFDIRTHMHRVALPHPGDQTELQELVSDLMSTRLDLSRPPWQFHVVEEYRGGSALIARLHHAIADGIALVQVLLSLTDSQPEADSTAPAENSAPRRSPLAQIGATVDGAVRSGTTLVNEGREALTEPDRLVEAAQLGMRGAAALGKLLFMPPDAATPLKGPLGVQKRAAWSLPVPLEHIKAIGRLSRGTVNDVLLNAVTGALRRYLVQRGADVTGLNIRAAVPVNLRPLDKPITELGNKFGVVFLSLPVGMEDPFERLLELRRRTDAIKSSPEAVIAFGLLYGIGMAPAPLADLAVSMFGSKATAVMTNVPGPRQPIYLAGARVDQTMFWVPQSGHLGLGVSIFSYAGSVLLGVAADEGLVPDPETIIADFHTEITDLLSLVRALDPPIQAEHALAVPAASADA